ncbi:MAG: glutamate-5-semialdehyde dehydrogenase [Candidatus Melainabacteria bacterium RIFCSPLOWO2_02_FULL_35_15]|nr:MAG: glutamate-5-semialdehyde dehydrogenase [Candidatus Melainabacteria bacterium RIFCSPLOWO2_12_FULL_35_11]OGI13859.1 MAG: glutamate-5-semialdehyde dehydrogenase [Candidatus Melainabacteria bacterium RIFCSPLOWO2_02_FULL_35_15]
MDTINQLKSAKSASGKLAKSSNKERNEALELISKELLLAKDQILAKNKKDIEEGKKNNLSNALLDRLLLNEKRLSGMTESIKKVIFQPDPLGKVLKTWKHPNGMNIKQISVPLGVICIIYEARPNVTTDAISLALKSGNAVILRGSQHATYSNQAIVDVIHKALKSFDPNIVQFIAAKNRDETIKILEAKEYVDLVIPRGGEDLKNFVLKHSKIPVIGAGGGTCHLFIDESAEEKKALDISINAKTQRPGVCNAIETILVHKNIAKDFLPRLEDVLKSKNVEIFACDRTQKIISNVKPATEDDWHKEYLDLKIAIKIVDSLDEAINHINKYGTKHSESIITENKAHAKRFQEEVDAACVYVNASTRFTDGEEFGFGAEIGISTQKLHARGPIALEQLVTYKYLINGEGQIRG